MKQITKHITLLALSLFVLGGTAFAQFSQQMQYYTYPDQRGLNQFEAPFQTDVEFDGIVVKIGGANTLQLQGLTHENASGTLPVLETNFNLATSNLDFDVMLDNGVRMHLRTYLSSQHHPEAWVKGGYLQVDRLDFIQEGFASDLMDKIRVKIGHMEINYGDTHFRRTDNAAAIHNPFVGNYIMDSFTTEVAGEVYYFDNGILAMLGLSNGKLNQSVTDKAGNNGLKTHASIYGKVGYDKQMNDDMRFRLTGSILTIPQSPSIHVYNGDRAGSRYYNVMNGSFRSGRFSPSYTPGFGQPPGIGEMTAIMINPFVKYQGFEFFGVFENVSGKLDAEPDTRTFNQYGAELLYRFGADEDIYFGGRYNLVSGELASGNDIDITRINIGGGWFMTKNVLAKLEYVNQTYDGFPTGDRRDGGEFNGVMLEAVISF